jgi:hypothetical protein
MDRAFAEFMVAVCEGYTEAGFAPRIPKKSRAYMEAAFGVSTVVV